MKRCLTIAALLLAPMLGAAQDYFPLEVGNQWIYRVSGVGEPRFVVVDIPRYEIVDGRPYWVVQGFPEGEAWLRMGDNSTLYAVDPQTGRESVWAVFSTPVGKTYETAITQCNHTAKVESRDAEVKVPTGEYFNALEISYPPGNCADAGLVSEKYIPYIGLVERVSESFAGPVTMSLVYSRTGVTELAAPQAAFTVALDKATYGTEPGVPSMTVRMALRITGPPIELTFGGGQRYDVEIRDADGTVVYRWSDGRVFTLALVTMTVGPGEKNFVVEFPLGTGKPPIPPNPVEKPLPPGHYTLTAWLNTTPAQYSATVPFEIVEAKQP